MRHISLVQNSLAVLPELSRLAEVNRSRGHQAEAGMMVFEVVPGKESLSPSVGIDQAAEALRIRGLILHGFKLCFRKGIVIRDVWAGMALVHTQVSQECGQRFGDHGSTPVGVNSQLLGLNVLSCTRLCDEHLSQVA